MRGSAVVGWTLALGAAGWALLQLFGLIGIVWWLCDIPGCLARLSFPGRSARHAMGIGTLAPSSCLPHTVPVGEICVIWMA